MLLILICHAQHPFEHSLKAKSAVHAESRLIWSYYSCCLLGPKQEESLKKRMSFLDPSSHWRTLLALYTAEPGGVKEIRNHGAWRQGVSRQKNTPHSSQGLHSQASSVGPCSSGCAV